MTGTLSATFIPAADDTAITTDDRALSRTGVNSPLLDTFSQPPVPSFTGLTTAMLPDPADAGSPATTGEENSGTVSPGSGHCQGGAPHETPASSAELSDPAVGIGADAWRIEEANRRLDILQTFTALVEGDLGSGAEGLSKAEAAQRIGESYTTIWRWQKRHAAHGYNGLIPETEKCGRKSWLEKLGMTAAQVEQVRNDVRGLNLDLQSVTASLRLYANSDRCPAPLAAVILDPTRCSKHAIAPSIRELARVNKNQRLAHRGPRALSLGGMWTPRRMDILPGDIFSADDTTPIWAWWVPWVTNEEYPFGVKLLQGQFIPVIDIASQCCVSYVIIAREKGSYRAADIWHLFGHTFDTVGLPRLGWQLERGSWEANLIRGQEISYEEGEVSYSRRVGGLRQLPTNITDWHRQKFGDDFKFPSTLQTWTSYLPRTKSVEAFLNRSQTFEGTLWGALGRDQMRAPFEKAKKKFQECQRGSADPRNHFLSHTEMAARLNALLGYLNREPMEGEVFYGVPEQRFASATAEHPLFVPGACEETQELQWLWRRDWSVVQITSGWARVRLTDPIAGRRYSLFYTNPAVFAAIEGEPVAVYYDRENFERPAQIIHAKSGKFLGEAQYEDRKGSFLDGDASGHDVRQQWRHAVTSVYGTLAKHAPSRQLPPEIAARRAESGRAGTPLPADGAHGVTRPTIATVDGRPVAVVPPARGLLTPPTQDQFARRRAQLAKQAETARTLRGLSGD